MELHDDVIIKQDSPDNILWQWFRMEVEKQVISEERLHKMKRFLQCLEVSE